jgi:probable F420-dependent oxidoreductase
LDAAGLDHFNRNAHNRCTASVRVSETIMSTTPSSGSARPFRFSVQAFEAGSAKEWFDTARRAEDLGYSALFATDHYFGPGEISASTGHRPVDVAPLSAIMAAAAATTTLRVGCRVFCVDYHHPVVLAKEVATIDLLSEGRLEVGLGAGWLAAEYEGLGVHMDSPRVRIERLAEVVEVLKCHWAGEPLNVDGAHVTARGFAGRPLPVQRPHPPLLIGGGAPRILRLAGKLADIVSINFNNASGKLGADSVARSSLAQTVEKVGWVREGAGDRFADLELEIAAYFVAVKVDPREAVATMAARFGVEPAELLQHPHALIGTVEEISERLEERRARLGVSYINIAQRHMDEFAPVVARLAGT